MFSFFATAVLPSVLNVVKEVLVTAAVAVAVYAVNNLWSWVQA